MRNVKILALFIMTGSAIVACAHKYKSATQVKFSVVVTAGYKSILLSSTENDGGISIEKQLPAFIQEQYRHLLSISLNV